MYMVPFNVTNIDHNEASKLRLKKKREGHPPPPPPPPHKKRSRSNRTCNC